MADQEEILIKVKQTILKIDPESKIILFGSRAKGNFRPDSDWDFLVLTSFSVNHEIEKKIWDNLFDIEVETDAAFGTLVYSLSTWDDYKATPLYQNVMKEGIMI